MGAPATPLRERSHSPTGLLVTCLVGMFATTFTVTILSVSIPRVSSDLHTTPDVIAWAVTAPLLAQAVAMPILGRLGDMRGHRRIYLVGFSLSLVFSVLTALAWNPASLIAFRTLAQLSGTATVPASFAMLFAAFPPERRVQASAWASGALSGASVTGLAVGGVIIDAIGWRPLFLIQAGLAAVALVPALFVLPRSEHRERVPLDKLGAATLAVTVFALTFGVNRLAVWGLHWAVGALAVVFVTGIALLVRVERRASAPVLPLELLARRNVKVACGTAALVNASHTSSFLVTPLLLQGVFGYSATATSLISMARTLAITVSAPSASQLGQRFGERRLAILAPALMAGAAGVLAFAAASTTIAVVVVGMVASGIGLGHLQPSVVALSGNAVEPHHFGLAASLQQTATQIGSVTASGFAVALVGDSEESGRFALAYVAAAVLAALGALVATRALRRRTGPAVVELTS